MLFVVKRYLMTEMHKNWTIFSYCFLFSTFPIVMERPVFSEKDHFNLKFYISTVIFRLFSIHISLKLPLFDEQTCVSLFRFATSVAFQTHFSPSIGRCWFSRQRTLNSGHKYIFELKKKLLFNMIHKKNTLFFTFNVLNFIWKQLLNDYL